MVELYNLNYFLYGVFYFWGWDSLDSEPPLGMCLRIYKWIS